MASCWLRINPLCGQQIPASLNPYWASMRQASFTRYRLQHRPTLTIRITDQDFALNAYVTIWKSRGSPHAFQNEGSIHNNTQELNIRENSWSWPAWNISRSGDVWWACCRGLLAYFSNKASVSTAILCWSLAASIGPVMFSLVAADRMSLRARNK